MSDTDDLGSFELQLRCLDVKNIEEGVLLQLGKTDPYYEVAKKSANGTDEWIVVYQSDPIYNNLNPFWDKTTIGLQELCYCDLNWPLKITVMDWNMMQNPKKVGSVVTTVEELMANKSLKGNADRSRAFTLKEELGSHQSGLLVVVDAKVCNASVEVCGYLQRD